MENAQKVPALTRQRKEVEDLDQKATLLWSNDATYTDCHISLIQFMSFGINTVDKTGSFY